MDSIRSGNAVGSGDTVGSSDAVGGSSGSVTGTSSNNSAQSSRLRLRSGDGILVSGKRSPVGVLVEVTVGLSDLTDGLSVVLNSGFGSTRLAFAEGAGVVLGGDCRVDSGSLGITGVNPID